ncbi:hypothetical protein [Propionivibrio dicarboxylicus]|uniref:Type II secretory pathway, pseudopilin PulG n=1 Tax=Propionivibrio dicarboxylicus TaxID=83767 RepID=A0A1G8FTS4_9RHOO|nr:hypothetical protein [Propionivibrio dicarboxylicus]SDH85520.1 hypothetical protein SAMN05660652_02424 [Propionivibrio dicarboxylicus]
MTHHPIANDRRQEGNVIAILLVLMTVLMLGALTDQLVTIARPRHQTTEEVLAQAREALLGFAATYRDTHAEQSFGYLPCPNLDNDGISSLSCGLAQVSALGRLPWKSLDLPNYRDSTGECLWYAIGGRAKGSHKTSQLNWDTQGQFLVQDIAGKLQHETSPHALPLAIVIAPGRPLPGQESRHTQRSDQCADIGAPDEHLENVDNRWSSTTHTGNIVITIGDDTKANDRVVWLNASDIFERIKRRKDFGADIETMMDDLATYLSKLAPNQLPMPTKTQKGVALLIENYLATNPVIAKKNVIHHWRDNLLYAANGDSKAFVLELDGRVQTCRAVLFFAGERTPLQRRSTAEEREDWRMYLEGVNAKTFPNPGKYTGTRSFRPNNSSTDIARCIG